MKSTYIILILALLVTIVLIFSKGTGPNNGDQTNTTSSNIEMKNNIQYITITAKGGYSPANTDAKAKIPTKLIIKTDSTYDCSSALIIRSIGFQKILTQTGEEIIDLGSPNKQTLQGICSMGMYSFQVNFN